MFSILQTHLDNHIIYVVLKIKIKNEFGIYRTFRANYFDCFVIQIIQTDYLHFINFVNLQIDYLYQTNSVKKAIMKDLD